MKVDVYLQALIKVFVERACSFLTSQMSHLGDAVLTGLSKSQQTGSVSLPDHRHIRQRLGLLCPLMQVSALVLSCERWLGHAALQLHLH